MFKSNLSKDFETFFNNYHGNCYVFNSQMFNSQKKKVRVSRNSGQRFGENQIVFINYFENLFTETCQTIFLENNFMVKNFFASIILNTKPRNSFQNILNSFFFQSDSNFKLSF